VGNRPWPTPVYHYGAHVTITPLESIRARVVDLHFIGLTSTVEYDVRYFADGKEHKIRVFEDELQWERPDGHQEQSG
jgi:uncharacterized protein YcfJ